MSRFGARVLLKNYCNPTKLSVIILVGKSLYFHPVKIYYSFKKQETALINDFTIGNSRYNIKQTIKEVVIFYQTENINIHFTQLRTMRARLEYQEKWLNGTERATIIIHGLGIDWEKLGKSRFEEISISCTFREVEWLAMCIPPGSIFNSFSVVLQLVEKLHKTGHFRLKMSTLRSRWFP
jgi:hypothetical protein